MAPNRFCWLGATLGGMKPTDFPVRHCREAVFSTQGMAYICELPALHYGPCMSQSIRATIESRNIWEAANPSLVAVSHPDDGVIDLMKGY